MSARPTYAQVESAVRSLQMMIDNAWTGGQAGEDAVMAAAAGPTLAKAAEPFAKAVKIIDWSERAISLPDDKSLPIGFAWNEHGKARTLTYGELRVLAAAYKQARGEG